MKKYFKCFTDKNPISYRCGEKITFTVFAKENGNKITCKKLGWGMRGDDGYNIKGIGEISPDKPLIISHRLQRAGFIHLYCVALDENNHQVEDFDPLNASAGADIFELKYSDVLPDDFNEYWGNIEKTVADFEATVISLKERANDIRKGFKAYDVRIKTPSGRPASGCVTIPTGNQKYPLKIMFLGYGIRAACFEYEENKICACFNAHGIENDKSDEELAIIYDKELSEYGFHDEENASNMTTYFRNMMIRDLIALKYLKTIPQWNQMDIIVDGGSQGALQAITVAAHDNAVTKVEARKPWLCDLNSVNHGYLNGWRPNFAEGLRYFDTVAQGMHIQCPITITCGLGDYVCPPKTVMALYNSIKSEKHITFVQSETHDHTYIVPEKEQVELNNNDIVS